MHMVGYDIKSVPDLALSVTVAASVSVHVHKQLCVRHKWIQMCPSD